MPGFDPLHRRRLPRNRGYRLKELFERMQRGILRVAPQEESERDEGEKEDEDG